MPFLYYHIDMNYYDELLNKIDKLINEGKYEEANKEIENELNVPYVPKDVELKLKSYLDEIKPFIRNNIFISIDDIEKYLFMDYEHQLIAVSELNKYNLRDYVDLCNKYLKSDGFKNAKVLLIDSLIRQEVNEEISYSDSGIDYYFIPKYIVPIEMSDGFNSSKKLLEEEYMKEPSKLLMAMDLLYKEALLSLPLTLDESESKYIANNIIIYIDKAFEN